MQYGLNDAIAKVGLTKFVSDLFLVGLFYHLYNQVTISCHANCTYALVGIIVVAFQLSYVIMPYCNSTSCTITLEGFLSYAM
jgi:solute carrier family 35 protein E1